MDCFHSRLYDMNQVNTGEINDGSGPLRVPEGHDGEHPQAWNSVLIFTLDDAWILFSSSLPCEQRWNSCPRE